MAYLRTLRTLREPHVPMPTLAEVVEFLAEPGAQAKWLLLDIKLDNDADDLIRLTAQAIRLVHPGGDRLWKQRIALGCWTLKYVPVYTIAAPQRRAQKTVR